MTLQQPKNIDPFIKALFVGLLVFCLFSCKSKQKTVRKEVTSLEQLEVKDIETSKIETSDTQQITRVKESVTLQEVKNATVKQTETKTTFTPVDHNQPSQATINGKTYNWQNSTIVEEEKSILSDSTSENIIKQSTSIENRLNGSKKTEETTAENSKKEHKEKSALSEKNKENKGFASGLIIWPMVVFIVVFGLVGLITRSNPFLFFINLFKRKKQ
ncbi:hypothetical protein LX95_01312 [Mesonia algae]|uniref:Uncharacterized protein n=1 Tax=Mesonia algae TaxID=213248 RepID=A0A2W7I416_9FLAO|nr:hypothetical protein [Mesonia algae]PZW41631.1 hypothetical protein LX95_01312 [Mesonia algae]